MTPQSPRPTPVAGVPPVVHPLVATPDATFRLMAEAMPQLVWSTRADGYHDYFNERWYAYTGMPRPGEPGGEGGPDGVPQGWHWKDYLHPEDFARTVARWARSLESGEPYEIEYRFRERATGAYRWFLGRAVPLRDEAGRVVRWFGTCTDIQARKESEALVAEQARELALQNEHLQQQAAELEAQSEQLKEQAAELEVQAQELEAQAVELQRSNDTLTRLLESIGDAFFHLDEAWRFTYVNARGAALLRRSAAELLDARIWTVFDHPDTAPFRDAYERAAATGRPASVEAFFAPLDAWFEARAYPVPDGVSVFFADVTQRKASEAEREALLAAAEAARADAERARRQAEEANRAKAAFLASMSHELRTPLNAIGGYAELIEMGVQGPVTAQQREALGRIRRSQRHLLGLITQILEYARVEAGRVTFRPEPVRVRDAVAHVRELIEPIARQKGVSLESRSDAADAVVLADWERLAQVLLNLLSNAVKFTAPGGRVDVTSDVVGDVVRIHVRDTGRGIPADRLRSVFEPFVQVEAGPAGVREGVGLGLAISRDLAEGMGGALSVTSAVDAGSTFTLSLPPAAPSTLGASDDDDRRGGGDRREGARRHLDDTTPDGTSDD